MLNNIISNMQDALYSILSMLCTLFLQASRLVVAGTSFRYEQQTVRSKTGFKVNHPQALVEKVVVHGHQRFSRIREHRRKPQNPQVDENQVDHGRDEGELGLCWLVLTVLRRRGLLIMTMMRALRHRRTDSRRRPIIQRFGIRQAIHLAEVKGGAAAAAAAAALWFAGGWGRCLTDAPQRWQRLRGRRVRR